MNQTEVIESYIRETQKKFNYNTVDYPLEYFLDKVSKEDIKQLQWSNEQQSYFIESLLMGLPVLNIIISDREEIIDGRQRLYSAINFINNNLKLVNIKQLSAMNDFSFSDLIPSRQRSFKRITVRATQTVPNADISQWQYLVN